MLGGVAAVILPSLLVMCGVVPTRVISVAFPIASHITLLSLPRWNLPEYPIYIHGNPNGGIGARWCVGQRTRGRPRLIRLVRQDEPTFEARRAVRQDRQGDGDHRRPDERCIWVAGIIHRTTLPSLREWERLRQTVARSFLRRDRDRLSWARCRTVPPASLSAHCPPLL